VSDDCITVTEGVNDVVLLPAPIDTAAEGYTTKQLQDAIFQTLKKYPLPAGLTSNPDLSTFILECETVLSITDEGLEQYASSGLISLVLEGGEEIALKKVCDKRTECKYQYQGNGVTAAAVEAALVAKEIEVLSVKETVLDAENGYAMVTAEVVGEVPADCVVEGAAPQHCGCCEAFYDPEAKGEEEVEGQKAISQMNVAELKEECNKKGIELQGNENKQALKDLLKED
jgi:hypothetical protein